MTEEWSRCRQPARHERFFIGERGVAGSGRMKIDLVNPATEETIGSVAVQARRREPRGRAQRRRPLYSCTSRAERLELFRAIPRDLSSAVAKEFAQAPTLCRWRPDQA